MAEAKKDFWERYSKYCMEEKLCPLKCIMRHFKGSELCLPVEAIRPDHWHYLLSCLCIDNSLTKLHFASCVSPHEDENSTKPKRNKRDKGFPPPYGRSQQNIRNISVCLAGLLRSSQALIILKLENLSITCFEAKQLSIGLSESCYLKLLSFSGCRFDPGALKIICNGLSRSCVTWLDLSSCALNPDDIEHIYNVIKAHSIRRTNQMFPQTLRYNFANLDELHGINRISLNYNFLDLDVIAILLECLEDDLWIKALDFQNCGIGNEGAKALLQLATANRSLEVIDLRLNDIDESLLQRIEQQLTINKTGKTQTCTYSPLWKPSEMIRKYNAIGKGKLSKKAAVYKFKIQVKKKSCKSITHSVKPTITHGKAIGVRTVGIQTRIEVCEKPQLMQEAISSLRMTIHNEKKIRHYYETRCKKLEKENRFLKEYLQNQSDDIYIDQETYLDIKHTFEKLKIFFDVMKKYGLWEYISMLGFDESTDVIIKEDDSLKCVKVLKKDTTACTGEVQEGKVIAEPCCNCRKMDPKHNHTETSCTASADAQNCDDKSSSKKSRNKNKTLKFEDPSNERVASKLLQEIVNDYNSSLLHSVYTMKSKQENMTETVNVPQDDINALDSKVSDPLFSKANSGTHMLVKKFSYASMPKQLKELVSPVDFYAILKKELERCGNEAKKSLIAYQAEKYADTSSQTSSEIPETKVSAEKTLPTNTAESSTGHTICEHKESSSNFPSETTNEEDYDNITISELIAREKAAKQKRASTKYIPTKKESAKSSVSSASSSKIHKGTNQAKIKETKSLVKSEQMMPKSKAKQSSNSSQTGSKKVPVRSNASSDEINSSDSVVTASDKLSTASSASSSPSSESRVKTSSSFNDSKQQKSYIESVSDASTFKDVESISDIEVNSPGFSQSGEEKDNGSKKEIVSSVKSTKDEFANTRSSTLKEELQSNTNRPGEASKSETSSIKVASKKSDKSTKTDTASQAKTKNTNKLHNKNRPKNNSSKSSSVPSLSDITTVSSKSLNTDSIMKQITGSDDNSKEKK